MTRKSITTLLSGGVLGLAGLVATGVVWQGAAVANDDAAKRDDDVADLVLVADDDDDDTNDNTRTNQTQSRNTGFSRATNDNTNSRFTKVSRDRDLSRSDKTKDWTRDGGTRTRDRSANQTNDTSRNDTRR